MNLIIPKRAKYKDLAFEFAQTLTNKENQLEFAKITNVLPANKKALNKKWFMLYLIVNTNDDGTEDITCEIKINNNRNI